MEEQNRDGANRALLGKFLAPKRGLVARSEQHVCRQKAANDYEVKMAVPSPVERNRAIYLILSMGKLASVKREDMDC